MSSVYVSVQEIHLLSKTHEETEQFNYDEIRNLIQIKQTCKDISGFQDLEVCLNMSVRTTCWFPNRQEMPKDSAPTEVMTLEAVRGEVGRE